MESIRAKFICNSIEITTAGKIAKCSAVYGNEGENKDYAEATPWGEFKIQIDNSRPAANFFEPGGYYYLDITKAPK